MQESLHPYTISSIDFESPFINEPQDFKRGDCVTRDNFTSFMIWTFALSRGTPQGQATVMEWLKQNEGFDWTEAIENFISVGGFKNLVNSEKSKLLIAVKGVKKHHEEEIIEADDTEMLLSIENEFQKVPGMSEGALLIRGDELQTSWDEFILILNKRIDYKLAYDAKKRQDPYGLFG